MRRADRAHTHHDTKLTKLTKEVCCGDASLHTAMRSR